MKIFDFTRQFDRWQRVEDEMYFVWLGNQSGAILPRWQDTDFKKCMMNLKKNYTLKECEKQLRLS